MQNGTAECRVRGGVEVHTYINIYIHIYISRYHYRCVEEKLGERLGVCFNCSSAGPRRLGRRARESGNGSRLRGNMGLVGNIAVDAVPLTFELWLHVAARTTIAFRLGIHDDRYRGAQLHTVCTGRATVGAAVTVKS